MAFCRRGGRSHGDRRLHGRFSGDVGNADSAAPERFSADNIEAADVELGASTASPANWHLSHKAPRIVTKNYSGPASLPQPPASASAIEMYRFILERFAAVSVSSIEAPSIAGTMNMAPAMAANFNYLGFALRDIKEGKIATMQIERASFTSNMQQAGKSDKLTGDIANVVSHDFDAPAGWCPAKLSYCQSIGRVEKAYAGWGFGDFIR